MDILNPKIETLEEADLFVSKIKELVSNNKDNSHQVEEAINNFLNLPLDDNAFFSQITVVLHYGHYFSTFISRNLEKAEGYLYRAVQLNNNNFDKQNNYLPSVYINHLQFIKSPIIRMQFLEKALKIVDDTYLLLVHVHFALEYRIIDEQVFQKYINKGYIFLKNNPKAVNFNAYDLLLDSLTSGLYFTNKNYDLAYEKTSVALKKIENLRKQGISDPNITLRYYDNLLLQVHSVILNDTHTNAYKTNIYNNTKKTLENLAGFKENIVFVQRLQLLTADYFYATKKYSKAIEYYILCNEYDVEETNLGLLRSYIKNRNKKQFLKVLNKQKIEIIKSYSKYSRL